MTLGPLRAIAPALALTLAWVAAPCRAEAAKAHADPATSDHTKKKWDKRDDRPWLHRWAPEPNMGELGLFGGMLILAERHELFAPDPEVIRHGHQALRVLNPDLGLRLGYYPLSFVGIEAEGTSMPSALRDDKDANALLYSVRGQIVAQLGLWSVTPFVLIGGGVIGIESKPEVLGRDLDPALHFGGGVKLFVNRWIALRLDARDLVSHRQGIEDTFSSHNFELTLGLSATLGHTRAPPSPLSSN